MKERIREFLKKLSGSGFLGIIISSTLVKAISFCSGIFIARLLSKYDYGVYGKVNNLLSMFMILDGIGTISGILQFSSQNTDNLGKMLAFESYGFKVGLTFNGVVAVALLLVGLFVPINGFEGANQMLCIMCLVPLSAYIANYFAILLRVRWKNKMYSIMTFVQSAITLIGAVLGAYFGGLIGVAIARVIGDISICAIYVIVLKQILFEKKSSYRLDGFEKKKFLSLSATSAFNNAIGQLLYMMDIFVIGIVIENAEITASYSAASKIPFALSFIPSAVMVFAYPYFAKNNSNRAWIKSTYFKMTGLLGALNVFITVVLILIAPYLIKFLFGDQYSDAVLIFRVLMLSYFISATFRIPSGNVIITQMKIKFNTVVAIVSGLLNIVFNVILTMKMGSIGAAITTVAIVTLSGIADFVYMLYLLYRKPKKRKRGNTPMEEYELSLIEKQIAEADKCASEESL